MQIEHMLQFFLIAVIGTRYYQRELWNLPAIGNLPAQSQQYKHLNKVWNLFKVNNKDTRNTSKDVVLVFLLLTLNRFHI